MAGLCDDMSGQVVAVCARRTTLVCDQQLGLQLVAAAVHPARVPSSGHALTGLGTAPRPPARHPGGPAVLCSSVGDLWDADVGQHVCVRGRAVCQDCVRARPLPGPCQQGPETLARAIVEARASNRHNRPRRPFCLPRTHGH